MRSLELKVHVFLGNIWCYFMQLIHFMNRMSPTLKGLPHFAVGRIIKGFGRGSKELGIPTANFPDEVVQTLPDSIGTGVYYGWASIENGPVYKMVMSIGWNPYYKNEKKSMEAHVLYEFNKDLYDSLLKVCMTGYIRPEMNFNSLDDLIATIKSDIVIATQNLDTPEMREFQNHPFFKSDIMNGV